MCLIALGWQLRPDYPLILAANRDEFFGRAAAPLAFWADEQDILAGRDLEKGGTWLGLSRTGQVAAVTNYRDGSQVKTGQRSRGWLVRDYLLSDQDPVQFLSELDASANTYDGFNLLAGSPRELFYYSNRSDARITPLSAGVHAISNHLLNTPWPKVQRARRGLEALVNLPASELADALFSLLADQTLPADAALPDTGLGLDRERLLSTAFIQGIEYGTRCSTVLLVQGNGLAWMEERTFDPGGSESTRRQIEVKLAGRVG